VPSDPVRWYDAHAAELVTTYEAVRSERLHAWFADLLPGAGGLALDVGAGTGRDAAWLASRGFEVVAVEPSVAMRKQAARLHADPRIRWVDDSLPGLHQVRRGGVRFDLILLSAVWMHVAPADRPRAFRSLATLLGPGGLLAITLRSGPSGADRGMHPVCADELGRLARAHGAVVERCVPAKDQQGRAEVSWTQVAIRSGDVQAQAMDVETVDDH
jgi:SAM-dependent methyltransferase